MTPLPRLEFLLRYSSDAKRDEYRCTGTVTAPAAALRYDETAIRSQPDKPAVAVQKRLQDRSLFTPMITIRGNFKVKALIDRIIILVAVKTPTSWSAVRKAIETKTDVSCLVGDMGAASVRQRYFERVVVPPEMGGLDTGRVFAIIVQEPTPKLLADILEVISSAWGIAGEVRLCLLELAVDFYPAKRFDAISRIIMREQMVGLLQRHHFCAGETFVNPTSDARQVYQGPNAVTSSEPVTSFLFASPSHAARRYPDSAVAEEHVRKRLARGSLDFQLYLDATVYRGSADEYLTWRMQHKITDKRNAAAKTVTTLPDDERRARIEVEISGQSRLSELGLKTIGDLSNYNFRTIHKKYLSLWLPTAPADIEGNTMIRRQLRDRGVYDAEMTWALEAHRAKVAKAVATKAGLKHERVRSGTGSTKQLKAWSECNDAAGQGCSVLSFISQSADVADATEGVGVAVLAD